MKKILLTAINAKYIHSNLAVYSLRAYAQSYFHGQAMESADCPHIEIAEYTINQLSDEILRDVYKRRPDILCISCYIWNIAYVEALVPEIAKILPQVQLWLGGPEVSYDAVQTLERLPQVTGVMKGEGEETFALLAAGTPLETLDGITYRRIGESGDEVIERPWREAVDLNKIPFVYQNLTEFEHKILYYESSRGCPFSCSYCLSSIDKRLRFRDLSLVKQELQFFIDHKVPQVKFIDRTFNCKKEHALEIWKYLKEQDQGVTNFHFEISADLLGEEEIRLITSMRPGLIQLEIGVQSTNPDTVREIQRSMRFEKVAENVRAIHAGGNVHQHLDLIAGLPWEDYESFHRSFNQVYHLHPEQLQLGFLKVLKGSLMSRNREDYGLVCKDTPPYEVLYTKWLSYEEILRLKGIEEMVEAYYNSGQFTRTLPELEKDVNDPFCLYEQLAAFYEAKHYHTLNHARAARYEILLEFIRTLSPGKEERYRELLTYDYYLRENARSRPAFAGEYSVAHRELRRFYEEEERERRYLPGYEGYDKNQMRKMTHLERLRQLGETVLFDYQKRDPLTHGARTVIIAKPL